MKPKLKVCGVTDPEFAAEAVRRGVDYIGVIFAPSGYILSKSRVRNGQQYPLLMVLR